MAKTIEGEGERKQVADALMCLCLEMAHGQHNQEDAFNRLSSLAPRVVALVEASQIDKPKAWLAGTGEDQEGEEEEAGDGSEHSIGSGSEGQDGGEEGEEVTWA